jgi:hypothetical protein
MNLPQVVGATWQRVESIAQREHIRTFSASTLPSMAHAGTVTSWSVQQGNETGCPSPFRIVGLWVDVSSGPQQDLHQILRFATRPPAHTECEAPIDFDGDGNFGPVTCGPTEVNVDAWDYYATLGSSWSLSLRSRPTEAEVSRDICTKKVATNPIGITGLELANAYYGWHLTDSWIFTVFASTQCEG